MGVFARSLAGSLLAVAATILAAGGAAAEKRVALVIGNAAYEHTAALPNPVRDADAIAGTLEALGFEVVRQSNVSQAEFGAALFDFEQKVTDADVALFYYAGHGMQVGGNNYLLSTNAQVENPYLIDAEGMRLDRILTLMEQHAAISIALVDACRDNPLADALRSKVGESSRSLGLTRGLARLDKPFANSLVAFATAPGTVALDGRQANSPFTQALVEHLDDPNVEISAVLKRVTNSVLEATDGKQRPEVVASMAREFYLNGQAVAAPVNDAQAALAAQTAARNAVAAQAALDFARSLNSLEGYRVVIETFKGTPQARMAEVALATLEQANRKETMLLTSVMPGVTAAGGTQQEEAALKLSEDERKGVQIVLSSLGYNTNGIDGQFGSGTREAIRQYQYASQRQPTGFLSRDEYDELVASQNAARQAMTGRAFVYSAKDLPDNADQRLIDALPALYDKPIRFGIHDGTLYIAVAGPSTYNDARALAGKAGGRLAMITSAGENDFVFSLIKDDKRFWDEGKDRWGYWSSGPFFGLEQAKDAKSATAGWRWTDGTALGFKAWDNGQPNEIRLNGTPAVGQYGSAGMSRPGLKPTWADVPAPPAPHGAPGLIIEIPPTGRG